MNEAARRGQERTFELRPRAFDGRRREVTAPRDVDSDHGDHHGPKTATSATMPMAGFGRPLSTLNGYSMFRPLSPVDLVDEEVLLPRSFVDLGRRLHEEDFVGRVRPRPSSRPLRRDDHAAGRETLHLERRNLAPAMITSVLRGRQSHPQHSASWIGAIAHSYPGSS